LIAVNLPLEISPSQKLDDFGYTKRCSKSIRLDQVLDSETYLSGSGLPQPLKGSPSRTSVIKSMMRAAFFGSCGYHQRKSALKTGKKSVGRVGSEPGAGFLTAAQQTTPV
jgi:hypothetical protein